MSDSKDAKPLRFVDVLDRTDLRNLLEEWERQYGEKLANTGQLMQKLITVFGLKAEQVDRMTFGEVLAKITPPVILQGEGENVIVFGKVVPPLYDVEYKIVNAIVDAGLDGLVGKTLTEKTGRDIGDIKKQLKSILKRDGWEGAILFPGKRGGMFRLAYR